MLCELQLSLHELSDTGHMQSSTEQSKAEQRRAEQSSAQQSRAAQRV